MTDTLCVVCGDIAPGKYGIPVDDNGDIVGVSYAGEWAGQPACEFCYAIHAAVKIPPAAFHERETTIVRDVLAAHVAAVAGLRTTHAHARAALKSIGGVIVETLETIGEFPAYGPPTGGPLPLPVVQLPPAATIPLGSRVRVLRTGRVFLRVMGDNWYEEPNTG